MDASLKKRISVASCWASSRIALLDSTEQYEDSYSITEEFREWIVCLGEDPELLKDSILFFPHSLKLNSKEENIDPDEVLEY